MPIANSKLYMYASCMYIANLLGAVALAVNDRVEMHVSDSAGLGTQAVAALGLISMRPGRSIQKLAVRLRLSHSATVRLVNALEKADLVSRTENGDKRVVRLTLSSAGETLLDRVQHARMRELNFMLCGLDGLQLEQLRRIFETIAANATGTMTDAYANCRFCDVPICEAKGCPVEMKARKIAFDGNIPTQPNGDKR